jgi:hypothetical protein
MAKFMHCTCSHTCGINGADVPERTFYHHQVTSKKLLAQAEAAQALTLSDDNLYSSPVPGRLRYAQGHSAYDSDSDSGSTQSQIETESENHDGPEMEGIEDENGGRVEEDEENLSTHSDSVSLDFTVEYLSRAA